MNSVKTKNVREQVDRILSSPLFQHSKRSGSLLKFIVERTLEGQASSLKERIIGIEVFGRTADFDASVDSTVRTAATEVRRRLALYYSEPEHEHELRIEIPTRSYVAEFRIPEERRHLDAPAMPSKNRSHVLLISATLIVVSSLIFMGLKLAKPLPFIDLFWAPVLNGPGPVALSIGSPSWENPVIPENQTKPELKDNTYLTHANFPLVDLSAANSVTSFLGRHGKECIMRFAQTTTLAELKGQPLILLGSFRNEWAIRLGSDLRFRFRQESANGLNWIEDSTNPTSRSWSVDKSLPPESITTEYALVTRAYSQTTGEWWIGIAGLRGTGTLAAQQAVLDSSVMGSLSNKLPKGWERKNLQLVLKVNVVNDSPGASEVIATYLW